jgi:two-component system phosphate regulon sensor histidine kinase PhoR
MLLRQVIALAFVAALTAACYALFFEHAPASAAFVAVAAVAGALAGGAFVAAGRRARGASIHETLAGTDDAAAMPEGGLSLMVAGGVPAGALLEATMQSMREGVLVVDGAMRVVASNNAARALLTNGLPPGEGPRRLTEVTRDSSIHDAFAAAIERGARTEVRFEALSLGERRSFDLHVAPLRRRVGTDPSREVRGAVGVFFDITRLERLERVRQEFLSNVSHELRTPLTAILTFVETLEDGAADDPAHNRHFLSVIRRNAERMHTLINDILELSAIEAGIVAVEPGPVRLAPLVAECFTALGSRAAERRVELQSEVGDEVFVRADARRLEQMLTNLVDNAIKFNHEGGRVVIRHELAGGRDRVSVADTGEGIAPEHLPRIFERFYRVDRARSRALGGTGLGLAIVKHLARAHGGEAGVTSEPGLGATFTIELPAHDETRQGREQ